MKIPETHPLYGLKGKDRRKKIKSLILDNLLSKMTLREFGEKIGIPSLVQIYSCSQKNGAVKKVLLYLEKEGRVLIFRDGRSFMITPGLDLPLKKEPTQTVFPNFTQECIDMAKNNDPILEAANNLIKVCITEVQKHVKANSEEEAVRVEFWRKQAEDAQYAVNDLRKKNLELQKELSRPMIAPHLQSLNQTY